MKLLPLKRYTLNSPLSPKAIVAALGSQVCGPDEYQQEMLKPYSGTVNDHSFAIRRLKPRKSNMVKSANHIAGNITATGTGSSINITMSFPILLFIASEIITLGVLMYFILTTAMNSDGFNYLYILPFIIGPFMFALLMLAWRVEVKHAMVFLHDLFKVKEEAVVN